MVAIEVMGVLNVTPDSFSDGGKYVDVETAVRRGEQLIQQGATFVDVGGESTRPGADPVSEAEEAARVLPVIRGLVARGIPVSVDTIHAATAEAAADAGAAFINDVSGGTHDDRMFAVAALASRGHGTRFIIGHWRGIPDLAHHRSEYSNVVTEVRDALAALAGQAIRAGVDPAHVIIDPGLGFDKTDAQCWQLLARLPELAATGYPVLVGASRKRMLGEMLGGLPGAVTAHIDACETHERDLATSVVSAFAARSGAWGVRVHDVAGTTQALAVEAAWSAAGLPAGADSLASAVVQVGSALHASPALHASTASDANANAAAQANVLTAAAAIAPAAGDRDRITLTGLEVFAHHGVFDFERENGQKFLIDAEVSVNLHAAAEGDALGETVHYGELADAIVAAVQRDPVDLIETVAERIAAVALRFPGVREARITVNKPDAPIEHPFENVSVTVVR